MQIITTTIDNSADSFLNTNSVTRYVNYPNRITCNDSIPTFSTDCKRCVYDPYYSHPFQSDSDISVQFILGDFALLDVTTAKVQILNSSEAVIKESDYIALTNNIDIVGTTLTWDEGLRLSLTFNPSNFTDQCFWIRGIFVVDGVSFEFTSQPYKRAHCTTLVKLQSSYRDLGFDCLGAYYDGVYENTYYLDADLELSGFSLNDVSYDTKGQKTYSENYDVYTLKALVNQTGAVILANILKGTDVKVNGKSYFNTKLLEKNNEINGMWAVEIELYTRCVSDIKRC